MDKECVCQKGKDEKKAKDWFNVIALGFAVALLLTLTIMQGLKLIDG